MRPTVKMSAIGLFCLVTLVAQGHARASTPGGHVRYGFAPGTAPLNDVTFGITVQADPGRANVFWSSQVSFTTHVAYIGMQRHRADQGQFLFSVWGALQARDGDKDTKCKTFYEPVNGIKSDNGYSCRLNKPLTAGHRYQFKLSPDGVGWYKGTVIDVDINQTTVLGSIYVGNGEKIRTDGMSNWVEYFDWNDKEARCMDEPYSRVRFDLPKANNGAITASVSATDDSAECPAQVRTTKNVSWTQHEDGIGISPSSSLVASDGRCLEGSVVPATVEGNPLVLAPCNHGNGQNWVIASDGTIRALYKCMTAYGPTIRLATCTGSKAQLWSAQGGALINQMSRTCLAIDRPLTVVACSGTTPQRWRAFVQPD